MQHFWLMSVVLIQTLRVGTGMYLMDCQAQIALAKMIGRDDAAATLQARFDTVNKAMLKTLWNESAGYFQNKLSADLAPVDRMAPTHFYPMLAGPEAGPSADQVKTTIKKHLTNPKRFAVWPTGDFPTDHPVPPAEARPLVQWASKSCDQGGGGCVHTLCCQLRCNFDQRGMQKLRYEGMGIASLPTSDGLESDQLRPLFVYACGANGTDLTLGPADWKPSHGHCARASSNGTTSDFPSAAAMYVLQSRTGPSAADLVELVQMYSAANQDHYLVASEAGKADAASSGYQQVASLGFVWPPPGTENATSRYGLPSISKDDVNYIDQNCEAPKRLRTFDRS